MSEKSKDLCFGRGEISLKLTKKINMYVENL
jgi:hypothetical protein